MDKTNLPPLPPSVDSVWAEWRGERELLPVRDTYYTADQMREYAARAVREAVPGWQPIETAPEHEGLVVLLYVPGYKAFEAYWGFGFLVQMGLSKKGAWCRNGRPLVLKPTHWMPLPAAPTQDQENG